MPLTLTFICRDMFWVSWPLEFEVLMLCEIAPCACLICDLSLLLVRGLPPVVFATRRLVVDVCSEEKRSGEFELSLPLKLLALVVSMLL